MVGAHAISLRNLARVLAEPRLCAFGLTEISAIGREALIASIAPQAKLDYLAPIAHTPGFARALSRTLRELRMEGVNAQDDLAILLALYEKELHERNYADVATRVSVRHAGGLRARPSLLRDSGDLPCCTRKAFP